MLDRVKHWKSTGAGVAVGAVVLAALKSMNCEVPNDVAGLLALVPVVMGALSK